MVRADEPTGRSSIEWVDAGDEVTLGPERQRSARVPRIWLILLVLLVIAGSATWYALRPAAKFVATYQGKTIDNAATVIAQADAAFAKYAASKHGAVSAHSRCYFDRTSESQSTDVGPAVYCGPVLFYLGTAPDMYLRYELGAVTAANGQVTLTTSLLPAERPVQVSAGDLERPDGRTAPHGADGIVAPGPIPAAPDLLVGVNRSDIGSLHAAPRTAFVIGRTVSVTVNQLGIVPTYLSGADAFGAPPGEHLLAFGWTLADGDTTTQYDDHPSVVSLSIDGGPNRNLSLDRGLGYYQFFVVAVPNDAQSVDIVVVDGDVVQRLSLLTGQPEPNGIAVLQRISRSVDVAVQNDANATISAPGTPTVTTTIQVVPTTTGLHYFELNGVKHAQGPQGAWLIVDACYVTPDTLSGDCTDGVATSAMTLTLGNGTVLRPREPGLYGDTVFDVPADFTSGVVTIQGSWTTYGSTLTLLQPIRLKVTAPE